jgi:hypothetical protein
MRSLHIPRVTTVAIGLLLDVVTSSAAQTARTAPTSPIAPGTSALPRGTGGIGPGPGSGVEVPSLRMPDLQSRIPAPLPPPPQPPIINGPLSPSGLPPMGGAR